MPDSATDAGGQPGMAFVTEREFPVARDLMFQIWTDCRHLKHWFGPSGYTMTQCKNDFHPGGMLHYCLQGPDGREMWGRWVYQEISVPLQLVTVCAFSDAQGGMTRHPLAPDWPLQTLSKTTFEARGECTLIRIEWWAYEATADEARAFTAAQAGIQQGWAGTLQQLERYLAGLK